MGDIIAHIQSVVALQESFACLNSHAAELLPPKPTEAMVFMMNVKYFLNKSDAGDECVTHIPIYTVEAESNPGSKMFSEDEGSLGYEEP